MTVVDANTELLSLAFLDMRATLESMLRMLTKGQADIADVRQTHNQAALAHIGSTLSQMQRDAATMTASIEDAQKAHSAIPR